MLTLNNEVIIMILFVLIIMNSIILLWYNLKFEFLEASVERLERGKKR